ncbi:GntR family transcriptional regulator [Saccharicrinis sp. FJH2]|uniref:GntR family transcriptional regulator n=1 Tax=unclassified Saccharicrinis TaxID=2646859 RepID=UPI0035D46960
MNLIQINNDLEVPKYKQIINSIFQAIQTGELKRGDKIPSLNQIKDEFGLSRDTVLAAFKELKDKKIISSTPGKGYYISTTNIKQKEKIFLMFDEFNAFKEDLYNGFIGEIGNNAAVDIYFHHFNRQVMETLVEENKYKYTSFVIMPGSIDNIAPVIKKLPFERTYILDRKSELPYLYGTIYQNFEEDIYDALVTGQMFLMKYEKLILVSPKGKEPEERKTGFVRFCKENSFDYELLESLDGKTIKQGEVYFVTHDRHLIQIIKQTEKFKLHLGKNIGLVSFNDTDLKEVVAGGITTISTDFKLMGQEMARMVLDRTKEIKENPSQLIIRKSL